MRSSILSFYTLIFIIKLPAIIPAIIHLSNNFSIIPHQEFVTYIIPHIRGYRNCLPLPITSKSIFQYCKHRRNIDDFKGIYLSRHYPKILKRCMPANVSRDGIECLCGKKIGSFELLIISMSVHR